MPGALLSTGAALSTDHHTAMILGAHALMLSPLILHCALTHGACTDAWF